MTDCYKIYRILTSWYYCIFSAHWFRKLIEFKKDYKTPQRIVKMQHDIDSEKKATRYMRQYTKRGNEKRKSFVHYMAYQN